MRTLRTILFLGICAVTASACSSETQGKDLDPNGADGGADDGDDGDGTTGPNGDDIDDDGDGFTEAQGDCDDQNAEIHPGANEYCNNLDDDCDGAIDDPTSLAEGQGSTAWADADGDGYGDRRTPGVACEFSEGWVDNDLDCDDSEATANPDGVEINFNDIDEDCDGQDYLLEQCIEDALRLTAREMENNGNGVPVDDFYNTYDMTLDVPIVGTQTFSGVGFGQVENQLALITDDTYIITESGRDFIVSFETTLGYNTATEQFLMTVGVEESWWDFGAFGYTIGDLLTTAVDAVPGTTIPENWDGTVSCYGYVPATPADFDGMMELSIDENRGRVTASVALESNVTALNEGDAVLTNLEGGQCSNDIIDAIAGYMGIGNTYAFLDENLELVGKQLVFTYETTLESNIAEQCSAP